MNKSIYIISIAVSIVIVIYFYAINFDNYVRNNVGKFSLFMVYPADIWNIWANGSSNQKYYWRF
jgi:predicted membrane-bound mannosyltransferase